MLTVKCSCCQMHPELSTSLSAENTNIRNEPAEGGPPSVPDVTHTRPSPDKPSGDNECQRMCQRMANKCSRSRLTKSHCAKVWWHSDQNYRQDIWLKSLCEEAAVQGDLVQENIQDWASWGQAHYKKIKCRTVIRRSPSSFSKRTLANFDFKVMWQ